MFTWSSDAQTWVYTIAPVLSEKSFNLSPHPSLIKSGLKEAKGTTARAMVKEGQVFCLEIASLVRSSFQICVLCLPSSFYCSFSALVPLTGNGKHYTLNLLPEKFWYQCEEDRKSPMIISEAIPTWMHVCASWCLSRGRMLNRVQKAYLLSVVVWNESWSRGQWQHFIWDRLWLPAGLSHS